MSVHSCQCANLSKSPIPNDDLPTSHMGTSLSGGQRPTRAGCSGGDLRLRGETDTHEKHSYKSGKGSLVQQC